MMMVVDVDEEPTDRQTPNEERRVRGSGLVQLL